MYIIFLVNISTKSKATTESQILVSSLPRSEETLMRFTGICVILYKIILYVEIKALLLVFAILCYSYSLYPKPYLDNLRGANARKSEFCQKCSPLHSVHSPCLSKTTEGWGRSFRVITFEWGWPALLEKTIKRNLRLKINPGLILR